MFVWCLLDFNSYFSVMVHMKTHSLTELKNCLKPQDETFHQ